MPLLDGKIAVITGAGTGLGRSYARLLSQQGAAVVVNDFASAAAQSTVEEIRGQGGRAVAAVADVGRVAGGIAILKAALDAFGRVDILVNNAGILRDKSLLKMEEDDWDEVVRVGRPLGLFEFIGAGRPEVRRPRVDHRAGRREPAHRRHRVR